MADRGGRVLPAGRFLMTWHLDRLARVATGALVLAALLVGATAYLVLAYSQAERVLGALLVGALIVAIGGVVGSTTTAAFGLVVFGFVTTVATPGPIVMAVAGLAGFVALMLIDLSIVLRRAPLIDREIWTDTAATIGVAIAAGAVFFAIGWVVSSIRTWQVLLVAVGFAAVGACVRVVSARHRAAVSDAVANRHT
ncbi:MAG: hypothetical protein AAF567_03160 [Actinomycetota bacterium]